jgi:(S)-2-hydroxyglutarate dehydrogenase
MSRYDVAIIGGGIVGLATAWQILRLRPGTSLLLIEKEDKLAAHQTGRNSGVIHSGIYYKPGSLRARNCRDGKLALEAFCDEHDVAWQQTGKVIVAVSDDQIPSLQNIHERGQQNGVRSSIIDKEQLLELEPHCCGIKAIHVPEAGIVDYSGVSRALADLITAAGGTIQLSTRLNRIDQRTDSVRLECDHDNVEATHVINCGGLFSDRIARLSGLPLKERIVPFRGEYYELKPEAEHLCRTLIYPVPDSRFPFLGAHFTRMIGGGVECGPNAVLALAREGYTWTTINLRDTLESLTYRGFLKLAVRNWKMGFGEIVRSLSKAAFVKALQKLVPEIRTEDLQAAPAGVRAQALGMDGRLVDDFVILRHERVLNVCNAPSPAATASLNIGLTIATRLFGDTDGSAR